MKFDRFLAKLFRCSTILIVALLLLSVFLFTACTCSEDDVFLCVFCGCVTPETCFACGNECYAACEASCNDCFDCVGDCVRCDFLCDKCQTAENQEALSNSCLGKCTVGMFDCINEYMEDCSCME